MDTTVLGYDYSGKEIIPVKDLLDMRTNRHRTTDGYSWGWIDGCTVNIIWSNDSKFNEKAASELVTKYNNRSR